MSVAGVHRLTLSLPPCSLSALSVLANGKRTSQSLLPHRSSVVHHSHRIVTSFCHNASDRADAAAEPSYGEGDMLDKKETSRKNPFVSEELLKKLKRYGVSGILSYGILNTVYYSTAFLLVWFYVAPAPGKMGYLAAAERFLKVMAMVWAGSQVTKLIRIGGIPGESIKYKAQLYQGGFCSRPGNIPDSPTENPFENGKRFYVLNKSEVQHNDWIRLYLELAVAKCRTTTQDPDVSNLKIMDVAIETHDLNEGLNAKNATVYISYKDFREARVGKDVDRIAVVRRTFSKRSGCFSLMGQHHSSEIIPRKGANQGEDNSCEAGAGEDADRIRSSFNEHARCLNRKGQDLSTEKKCKYQRVIRRLGVNKPHKAYRNHGVGLARRLHKTRST